jgi:cell division protease FtsH
MRQSHKTLLLWITLIFAFLAIWQILNNQTREHVPLTELMEQLRTHPDHFVADAPVVRLHSEGTLVRFEARRAKDSRLLTSYGQLDSEALKALHASRLTFAMEEDIRWAEVILTWIPLFLLFVLFAFYLTRFFVRRWDGGVEPRVERFLSDSPTLADVGGFHDEKAALRELLGRDEHDEDDLSAPPRPRALILAGPHGSGKSYLARALAAELRGPLVVTDAVDLLGVPPSLPASERVRRLFELTRFARVLCIENIEAIACRPRISGAADRDREQALAELLRRIETLRAGVLVIGTTTQPLLVADALLGAGRFERILTIALPSDAERVEILQEILERYRVHDPAVVPEIARSCAGFTPAALRQVAVQAARAARHRHKADPTTPRGITSADIESARDTVARSVFWRKRNAPVLLESANGRLVAGEVVPVLVNLNDGTRVGGTLEWMDAQHLMVRGNGAAAPAPDILLSRASVRAIVFESAVPDESAGEPPRTVSVA